MAAARAWPARQANVGTERVTGREGPAPGTARSHFFRDTLIIWHLYTFL